MDRGTFVREAVEGWKKLKPGVDLRTLELMQTLIWSGRFSEELLQRKSLSLGVSHRGDYEVLAVLRRAEPVHPTALQLAMLLRISQSGMSGKLDRLESQGLVQRSKAKRDGRELSVRLTADGKELVDEAFDESLKLYNSILASLDQRQRDELLAILSDLLERLEALNRGRS